MALTYDLTKVDRATFEQLISDEPDPGNAEGDSYDGWSITQGLIMRTISLGMGDLTEESAPEFYVRSAIYTALFGGIKYTPAHIQARIGLRTNVTKETDASWRKRMFEYARRDAEHTYREAVKS